MIHSVPSEAEQDRVDQQRPASGPEPPARTAGGIPAGRPQDDGHARCRQVDGGTDPGSRRDHPSSSHRQLCGPELWPRRLHCPKDRSISSNWFRTVPAAGWNGRRRSRWAISRNDRPVGGNDHDHDPCCTNRQPAFDSPPIGSSCHLVWLMRRFAGCFSPLQRGIGRATRLQDMNYTALPGGKIEIRMKFSAPVAAPQVFTTERRRASRWILPIPAMA